jgi:hypothetical protein
VPTLSRLVYVVGCTILYLLAVVVVALVLFSGWWLFVIFVLHGMGCDGACNGIGDSTRDYALAIVFVLTIVVGLGLLPVYRRLIRDGSTDENFYRE